MRRPHIPHRTKPQGRVPVMRALRDEFAIVLHSALWALDNAPSVEVFDSLAAIFNVVQLALEHDKKHQHEARLITGGAAALNQVMPKVEAGLPLHDHETAPIRVGVNTIDGLLGRLDVTQLYLAMTKLNAMKSAAQEAA
jgi:hypothetical protein